jgi:hypothetical protein
MGPAEQDSLARSAASAVSRMLERMVVYRHASDQHDSYVREALADLRVALEHRERLEIEVEAEGLGFEGALLRAAKSLRLYQDGIRRLCFQRGITEEELSAFARIAAAEEAEGEDALTELWKADLPHLAMSALPGYGMQGADTVSAVSEIALRAQAAVDGGAPVHDEADLPLLWNDEERRAADTQDPGRLAGRAAATLLRIVGEEYAGWDADALKHSFGRLADRMLQLEAVEPLARTLLELKAMPGLPGGEFRDWMSGFIGDGRRLEKAFSMPGAAKLLSAWLALFPPAAGPEVVALLPKAQDDAAREAVAAAALARIDSCASEVAQMLRSGTEADVKALASGLGGLPSGRRAQLGAAAFDNPRLAVAAIDHLRQDPAAAVGILGSALEHQLREVRLAAALALSSLQGAGDRAAKHLIDAISSPRFADRSAEEKLAFHRALGKLGSTVGFLFLSAQLSQPSKKMFGRQKRTQLQLLAVAGLSEEVSERALRAVEDAGRREESRALSSACREAAERMRTRNKQ